MANTTPQETFYSTQDVITPDIDTYYSKVILDIDMYRSRFNATTSNIQQSISKNSLDTIFSQHDAYSPVPVESRCSTFYRMLGLPVLSGDGSSMYSPGFDPSTNRDDDKRARKLEIANSLLNKLRNILDARERYAKNSANLFKNQDDVSTALAISAIYPRPFEKQFKEDIGPLEIDYQSFEVPDRHTVYSVFPDDFRDLTLSRGVNLQSSTHILKPFVVDPRIELTVTPAPNRICVPFLSDSSQTQLSKGNYLKRPYIEKVIGTRLVNISTISNPDVPEINAFFNDIVDFIKNNSNITDPKLVQEASDSIMVSAGEAIIIFSKFINILEALLPSLLFLKIDIERMCSKINWKPIPDPGGPEFGSSLPKVNDSDKFNQELELNIANTNLNKFMSQTDFNIGVNTPDLGGFTFSNIDDITFSSSENNYDSYDKQLSDMNKERDESGAKANNNLRHIEIITGEFSGLGLLDIFAIQAALWSISLEALLGLVDEDARARIQAIPKLANEVAFLAPLPALQEFEKKVSELYVLMGGVYQGLVNAGRI